MQAAPLIATADAPIPPGARAFWFEGEDGARLRAALFPAQGEARGSVVLSTGRSEPIEKYFEAIHELQARGFTVLAHDWRGQGLSHRMLEDRLKGHAESHDSFLADLRLLLAQAGPELPRPWIACGHSMGAALTAMALGRGMGRFDAALLLAPMMGLATARALQGAGALIAALAGRSGMASAYVLKDGHDPFLGPFSDNVLTHDERRYERYRGQLRAHPDLALGGITWGWLDFAMRAGAQLAKPHAARNLQMPLTLVAAGDDRLVLNGPARRFAAHAPQCRYVEIAGARHELLMETDPIRGEVWREFDALVERIRPPSA